MDSVAIYGAEIPSIVSRTFTLEGMSTEAPGLPKSITYHPGKSQGGETGNLEIHGDTNLHAF